MIPNRKQLTAIVKEIKDLGKRMKEIENSESVTDKFQLYAWHGRLNDLQADVDEFNKLIKESILNFNEKNLDKLIIYMRIASGMTQRQLAQALEVREQQIQRYEQTQYLNASFERIIQIVRVLSKNFNLTVEVNKDDKTGPTDHRFGYLKNSYPDLEKVTRKVKDRKALVA